MNFPKPQVLLLVCFAMAGCDTESDDSSSDPVSVSESHRIAGTVAQGRPGRWSEVCLYNSDQCTRADQYGDFLLPASLTESALLRATIPEVDGTTRTLYGLVEQDNEQTTYLANLNPTTHALIEAWSLFEYGFTLPECLTETGCESNLATSLNLRARQNAADFLKAWLNPVWLTARDPFHANYVANPAQDWLDRFHDHFQFSNDATSLSLLNNNNTTVAVVSHLDLFSADAEPEPLSTSLANEALAIPPVTPIDDSPVIVSWQIEPGLQLSAPESFTLDASSSRSSEPGGLLFQVDWVTPQGELSRYSQPIVEVDISQGGNHLWVVTVIDSVGNQLTRGLILDSRRADTVTNPQYGADGSCRTISMTPNSANICEETVDGGLLGACVPTISGQTLTEKTPAPCSPIAQNGGAFLGICTSVFNELRVFHYDNPLRDTGETFETQRIREAERCAAILGGSWSSQP